MSIVKIALLPDRGVVSVTGADARTFLDNIVTNDLARLDGQVAVHAALLSPQGKILFEFLVVHAQAGFLLDVQRGSAANLIKRLAMYKLRADVAISDVSSAFAVLALWGQDRCSSGETSGSVSFADPRHPDLGLRILAEARFQADIASATNGVRVAADDYHAHRVALGVPEGGRDYPLGDTFPHEANFDQLNGVSFTKGCYVGQEVVARMQHKSVVRKRVVRIRAEAALTSGADVRVGEAVIGTVGTVAGRDALAMLRLDRAVEAIGKQLPITAASVPITVDGDTIAAYRAAASAKASPS